MVESLERVFRGPENAAAEARRWRRRAVGWTALAMLGVAAAIVLRLDIVTRTLVTVAPALSALGAFVRARSLGRLPREVRVDDQGLRVTAASDTRFHPWVALGWSTVHLEALSKRRVLRLFDREGELLERIEESVEGFEELDLLLVERLGRRDDGVGSRIQLARARRSALFHGAVALLFVALGVSVVHWTLEKKRDREHLAATGVRGHASVESRHLAPDGRTPRLVYRVTLADGRSATRNAEMDPDAWLALEGATEVEVVHAPDRPELSHLVAGEVVRDDLLDQPWLGGLAGAAVAAVGLLLLVGAGFQWRGLDLDIDSKTRKISIKPYGTGR